MVLKRILGASVFLPTLVMAQSHLVDDVFDQTDLLTAGYISLNNSGESTNLRVSPIELKLPFSNSYFLPIRLVSNIPLDAKLTKAKRGKDALSDIDSGNANLQATLYSWNASEARDDEFSSGSGVCDFSELDIYAKCQLDVVAGVRNITFKYQDKYQSSTIGYVSFPMKISVNANGDNQGFGLFKVGLAPVVNYVDRQAFLDFSGVSAKSQKALFSLDAFVGLNLTKSLSLSAYSSIYAHDYGGERDLYVSLNWDF